MLPEGEFHMLRDLYRQGLSISEIARQTGYNRRIVSKYVKAEVPTSIQEAISKAKQAGFLQGLHHPASQQSLAELDNTSRRRYEN